MARATLQLGSSVFFIILCSGILQAQPILRESQGSSPRDTTVPVITEGPTIRQNPNPTVPLAAIIDLRTSEPTQVRLDVDDGTNSWTTPAEGEFKTIHEVPVIGMRPGQRHKILVTVNDRTGNQAAADEPLHYMTPLLPPDFPPLEVRISVPALMEPGPIGFATTYSSQDGRSGSWRILLSRSGDVIWYHRDSTAGGNVERLRNGNLLATMGGRELIAEIDLLGNFVDTWVSRLFKGNAPADAVLVDTDTMHHEILELPEAHDADFLTLSTEARIYPDYPADERDSSVTVPLAKVIGDIIVEFERDGTIVRETSLFDVLDPYRICYDSLKGGFWDGFYGDAEYPHVHDWTHANAVILDPRDGNYIVSLRHQDAVVKVVPESTGPEGVVWILGAPGRWVSPWREKLLKPISSTRFHWQFHQHAPELDSAGRLVLFDNGNYRAIPSALPMPPDTWYSRAVELDIDEVHHTVQQTWVYGGPSDLPTNQFYSRFICDADPLPRSGNVLVTDGGRTTPSGVNWARIVEVTHTDPAVPVFEVVIRDPDESVSWRVYRAEKLTR